jgi:hypothetical protein
MIQFSQAIKSYIASAQFKNCRYRTFEQLVNESRDLSFPGPDGLPFLPIEWLRQESDRYFSGKNIAKIFYSSGTQSETPSKSLYSEDGLLAYKLSCLTGLMNFCQREDIQFARIVSLVPNLSEWPNSSLSQMLEWFSEFIPTTFISEASFTSALKSSSHPTLFVGTAFHWINLLDQHQGFSFPKNSFLLETGGTKGRSRHLGRQDFYSLLREKFQLDSRQIISEYGMSELSSQAWARGDENSSFQFDDWVKIHITKGQSQLELSGVGSLVVSDPTRLDYPYPFRIQDIASLANQKFTILGRVPTAVAKGCSLMAEQPKLAVKESIAVPSKSEMKRRDYLELKEVFYRLCQTKAFLSSLTEEFFSEELANRAIQDLLKSFPKTKVDFEQALLASSLQSEHILIVPPSTHSIAILHPLVLGIGLGAKIRVRIPESFQRETSSLRVLLKTFQDAFLDQVKECPRDEVLVGFPDELLVFFGSNESLVEIRKSYLGKIAAYSSALAISIVSNLDHLELALLDALALASKGCMSARAIYVVDQNANDILKAAQKAMTNLPKLSLSAFEYCPLDHYETHLTKEKVPFLNRSHSNEILISLPKNLDYPLPTQLLSLPIYSLSSSTLENFLKSLGSAIFLSSDLHSLALNPSITHRPLGELNVSFFDGFHQKRPLFWPIH